MKKTENCNRQLRGFLERRESILLPGAANALAARVIEDIGFKAIGMQELEKMGFSMILYAVQRCRPRLRACRRFSGI